MSLHKKFGMISLGCDKNRVDGERILGVIREHGGEITDDPSQAQVLIVNTCAFLGAARQEAIETILECNEYRAQKLEKLVVTGCLPEKFIGELFDGLTEADIFLGIDDREYFFEALEKSYAGERVNYVGKSKEDVRGARVLTTSPHYAYLKISDGCNNHCTYCLIPKIRGAYRSYPMEELISEAKSLGQLSELILVAQDTTRYGEDLYGEKKLVDLLKKLSELDNICHIRLLYCYPEAITEELIAEIRDNPKIVHYLDIPMQHSEDRILKLMGRKGTRASYLSLLSRLREAVPDLAVRTTFISGFPSETEEEHRALMRFLEEAKLVNCGFFAYSREPDTPAYRLKGQVHPSTKKRRVRELYEVQAKISREYLQGYVGKEICVVCDGVDYEKGCFTGRTYFQAPEIDGTVYFRSAEAETGKTYRVFAERADDYDLYGHTTEEMQ